MVVLKSEDIRRRARWLLAACWLWPAGCAAAPDPFGGPLPVRNQHPAQLLVMHMEPAAIGTLGAGAVAARVDAAYSSLWLSGSAGPGSGTAIELDGEYLRAALHTAVGLGAGLELAAELPVAHTSGGFLDSFVIGYHDLFGMPDQGRDAAPRDAYEIRASRDSNDVFAVREEDLRLCDLPLWLTWTLVEPGEDRLGVAVRGGLELPTGDDKRGFGNGGIDWSGGVLLQYQTGPLAFYGHAQHTFAKSPELARTNNFAFGDVTSAGVGLEWRLADGLAALVQCEWETSTLRALGFDRAADDQVLLWAGGRAALGSTTAIEFGLGEDLVSFVSPDFTVWAAFVWRPGAGSGVSR